MSPEPDDLPVFNGKSEVCSTNSGQALEPAQSTIDGMSIASDVSSVTISSGSTAKSDGMTASTGADQPLVRDTRCDLLAAIREGMSDLQNDLDSFIYVVDLYSTHHIV